MPQLASVPSQKYVDILPPIHPCSRRGTELLEFGFVPERLRSPYPTDTTRSGALRAGRLGGRILSTYFRDGTLA